MKLIGILRPQKDAKNKLEEKFREIEEGRQYIEYCEQLEYLLDKIFKSRETINRKSKKQIQEMPVFERVEFLENVSKNYVRFQIAEAQAIEITQFIEEIQSSGILDPV